MINKLSKLVGSHSDIEKELKLYPESRKIVSKLLQLLDQIDFRTAMGLSVFIPTIYFILAVLHTNFFYKTTEIAPFDSTIAAVFSSIIAILFAVVVFSVQLHASRTDESAFSIPYILRAHRVYLILALGTGVALANTLAILTTLIWPSFRLDAVNWLNLIFVLIVFLSSLWFTFKTLRAATESIFDLTLPLFNRDMVHTIVRNTRWHRMNKIFRSNCEKLGFKHGWVYSHASPDVHEFSFSEEGTIVDINLNAFNKLANLLHLSASTFDIYINITIGQEDMRDPVLKLVPSVNITDVKEVVGPIENSTILHPELPTLEIQKALVLIPIMKADADYRHSQALCDFQTRFGAYLYELAQGSRIHKLKSMLKHLESMTKKWIEVAPEEPLGTKASWFHSSSDAFYGPLNVDLHSAILVAIQSGDEDTIEEFLSFFDKLILFAIRERRPILMNEIGSLILFFYHKAASSKSLKDFCTRRFDVSLYHLFVYFRSLRLILTEARLSTTNEYEIEQPCLDQALNIALNLIKISIEQNNDTNSKLFVDRLFEHEEYRERHFDWNCKAPQEDCVSTLFDYVRIVLAGWCTTYIKNYPNGSNAAQSVLIKVTSSNHITTLRLMGVWELYKSSEAKTPIKNRLGIEHWEPNEPSETRGGVSEGYWCDQYWIDRGLHTMLLTVINVTPSEIDDYFSYPPPQHVWNVSNSKEWLKELVTQELLHIPEEDYPARITAILNSIRSRQYSADLQHTEKIITETVDVSIWDSFVEDIRKSWANNRLWINAIESLNLSHTLDAKILPLRNRAGAWLWRDFFLQNNNWRHGFGDLIGKPLARRESQALFWCSQELGSKGNPIEHLADLEDQVLSAINLLRNSGFQPNLILVPQIYRIEHALLGATFRTHANAIEFGEACIGRWNDMLILRWPYTNADYVMVADSNRLFGKQVVDQDQVTVQLKDLTESERTDLLQSVRQNVDAGESPTTTHIKVLCEASLIPEYGINDPEAAIVLNLGSSDTCHTISTKDAYYHRKVCSEILDDNKITKTLSKCLPYESENRKPCPKCRPDKMDSEARF